MLYCKKVKKMTTKLDEAIKKMHTFLQSNGYKEGEYQIQVHDFLNQYGKKYVIGRTVPEGLDFWSDGEQYKLAAMLVEQEE